MDSPVPQTPRLASTAATKTGPGALLHADVKELANIPDGGGHRMVGRQQGQQHGAATPGKRRNPHGHKRTGHAFVQSHRRAAAGGLSFAARRVTVERVLTDNGSCYRSHLWRQQCQNLEITHTRTPALRPQVNCEVLTPACAPLAAGWAFRGSTPGSRCCSCCWPINHRRTGPCRYCPSHPRLRVGRRVAGAR